MICSPRVFDALCNAGLLVQIGTEEFMWGDEIKTNPVFGLPVEETDEEYTGNVICTLIEGEIIK